MKTVILHIGMHKTGSTSIQKALSGYDDGRTFYAKLDEDNHSLALQTVFSDEAAENSPLARRGLSASQIEEAKERTLDRLNAQLVRSDRERIILSGEQMGLLDDGAKERLVEYLRGYCDDIRVVCYLRHPTEFAASAFQEIVKNGRTPTEAELTPQYRRRLAKFIELLGRENVEIRKYVPTAEDGTCAVSDFAEFLELDVDAATAPRANRSLSVEAMRLLHLFHRTCPVTEGDRAMFYARHLFRIEIETAYPPSEPLDQTMFVGFVDDDEIAFLSEVCDIEFDMPASDNLLTIEDLQKWLTVRRGLPSQPLRDSLKRFHLDGNYDGLKPLLHRIFYHCVYLASLRERAQMLNRMAAVQERAGEAEKAKLYRTMALGADVDKFLL